MAHVFTLVPALAAGDGCEGGLACATKPWVSPSLLQRRFSLGEEVPLIQEFTPEMYHRPEHKDYGHPESCSELKSFRNKSMLLVETSSREALARRAQEQLRLAEEMLELRNDTNATLLMELRKLEEHRWNQERVPLSLFNPSVVPLPSSWQQSPEERWLASFRHMELSRETTHCMPKALSNIILLAVLDADFRPTRPVSLMTYRDLLPEHFQCQEYKDSVYLGPEDPRLFLLGEKVIMLYNSRRPSHTLRARCPKRAGRMYVADIMQDLLVHGQHKVIPFSSEEHGRSASIAGRPLGHWEKNWAPFVYTDESTGKEQLFVEEDMHPHVVLSIEEGFVAGDVVYNSSSPLVDEWSRRQYGEVMRLHGGVSPVLFTEAVPGLDVEPPFYLSVLHTRSFPWGGTKRPWWNSDMMLYDSYFCIFEGKAPFAITRVGHKVLPLVPDRSVFYFLVAFPTQMIRVASDGSADPSGDHLMIMYGAGDAAARLLRLPIERLPEFLE